MSKGVDRDQVLQTTRVRTALKNDGSWIHKSKQENEEMEKAVETRPIPVQKKSYVFSAAKKFDQTEIKVEPSAVTEPENATYLADAGAKSMPQPSMESCKTFSPKQVAAETVEAEAKDVVDLLPETPAVNNATPGEKAALQHSVEQDPDIVSKSSTQSAAETAVKAAESKVAESKVAESKVKSAESKVAESKVAESKVKSAESKVAESKVMSAESKVKSAESKVAESKVKSAESKVMNAESKVAESKVTESKVTESKVKSAESKVMNAESKVAESKVAESKVTESKVKSAAIAEPVLKTGAKEEIVECEAQPVENGVVKQSMDSVPGSAANCVMELNTEDAVEPVSAAEGEVVQDKLSDRAIELTDALDVVPPTGETVPECVNDPEQSNSEKSKLNQSDGTNNTEEFKEPSEELQSTHTLVKIRKGKAVCSFCDQKMDGNVKITISEPPLTCHDECLKCGVCAKALGDLLTPMYLHHQVIHCNGCFVKALRT